MKATWNQIKTKIHPPLLEEMHRDLKNNPLLREFVILQMPGNAIWGHGEKGLVYHRSKFQALDSQLRILEQYDCIHCIERESLYRPAKYYFDEEFVDVLLANL